MTSPIFRIHLVELRQGWVEISAPDEDRARMAAWKGGFEAAGKVHAEYTKKVSLKLGVRDE